METIARLPAVEHARRILRETDQETMADLLELVQIPAPSFDEGARAERFRQRYEDVGLTDIYLDEVGNLLALLPSDGPALVESESSDAMDRMAAGASGGAGRATAPIILAAHLDTVFPADTDLTPRREGARYLAPGIGDNTRGLAALLALGRALVGAGIRTVHPVVFVGTVGEEGTGDLHGVKHLFRDGSPWRAAAAFIGVDGTGTRRIVNQALGSKRFRAVLSGPGGHSWADWGRANPVHALGRAVAELADLISPRHPRSTLNVGRIGGGTSINTIPADAWLELDLRSEDGRALVELEIEARRTIEEAGREANQHRRSGTPALELQLEVVGDRPAGLTPPESPVVAAALAATGFIGETAELIASSTDANVPISLGIPAITLGAGGRSDGAHTLGEWYENEGGVAGLERLLLTLLALARIA
jgi:acetylornithine deacetylase/succinyl-diaminopimelate desuccinylase-like protein